MTCKLVGSRDVHRPWHRTAMVVSLALALVLSGCAGLIPGGGPDTTMSESRTASPGSSGTPTVTATPVQTETPPTGGETSGLFPADPANDTVGWEGGYWYNESIPVDGPGLNASELDALVNRTVARVEVGRDIEVENLSITTVGPGAYANRTVDYTASEEREEKTPLEALLLVGENRTAESAYRQLYAGGIRAFWNDSRREVTIVVRGEPVDVRPQVLAHEVSHAVQQQRFGGMNIFSRLLDEGQAFDGVREGDAEVVQHWYDWRCGTAWSCYEPGEVPGSPGFEVPETGLDLLFRYPYIDGQAYVARTYRRGGFDAVTELWFDLPSSTLEVSVPQYRDNYSTAAIYLSVNATDGWERVWFESGRTHYRFGPVGISTMLGYTAFDDYNESAVVRNDTLFDRDSDGDLGEPPPINYTLSPTPAWTGDRLHLYEKGGRTGWVWRLSWRSPDAAGRFADRYRAVLSHWDATRTEAGTWEFVPRSPFAGVIDVSVNGSVVTVIHGPTPGAIDALRPEPPAAN